MLLSHVRFLVELPMALPRRITDGELNAEIEQYSRKKLVNIQIHHPNKPPTRSPIPPKFGRHEAGNNPFPTEFRDDEEILEIGFRTKDHLNVLINAEE
jgi:hypothetical protein